MAFSFASIALFSPLIAILMWVDMEPNAQFVITSTLTIVGVAISVFTLFGQKIRLIYGEGSPISSTTTSR